jgi:hypothetical protein
MFESISRSWDLMVASWRVLYTDKKLIVFPILSGIACFVVLLSFFVPLVVLISNGTIPVEADERTYVPLWVYAFLFAFYFCSYFVIVFCNAALVSCALMRFNGQEPTITGGLGAATARLPQILAWSLVSATVGVLLKLIENVNERVGEVVAMVLGTGWTIITYFVVPVLVVEKVGPFEAIKRSVSLLRQTWGTALVGGIRLGFFQFLLFIPGILLIVLGGYLSSSVEPQFLGFGVVIFGLVYLLFAAAISAALDTIFLSALYQYAANKQIPAGFDAATIERAFEPKKS